MNRFVSDLRARLSEVRATRWVRFAIVSLLFFLWVIWMGNPWLLLIWPLLIDIYITQYIPWGWWKNTRKPVRNIFSWLDAIIYALVIVYFIFAFIGQNYKIPSSSLEKSLLVGDYLWVNKTLYGPRVPQTPLHFPLAQHTLPIINTKSYIDSPQLKYHRLAGIRDIERGDIVVFNYPNGDTVATKIQNPDYYQICYELSKRGIENPRAYIEANKSTFGDIVARPVDRRENYVKRAVGLPGETLQIRDDVIYIDGKPIEDADNVQYNYIVPVNSTIAESKWQEIGVRAEDCGSSPMSVAGIPYMFYDVPLTRDMKARVEKWPEVTGPLVKESKAGIFEFDGMFPLGHSDNWTRSNMGPIWIPKKGNTIGLNLNNLPVYERVIRNYEGNDLQVRDGKIYINGRPADSYTFKMDYYWMQGDNRDRSADSRYWGFVPEDHVVGSPVFVLASFDEEKGLFDGKIRWNRILRNANPDKDSKWK